MHARQSGRQSIAAANRYWAALCRPLDPEKEMAKCSSTWPLGTTSAHCRPHRIKLPKTAQRHLSEIKVRLILGCATGRISAAFVKRAFREFPELAEA